MERAGVFARAAECNKTIFIRSIYLQGLVVMEPERVPRAIPRAEQAVTELARFCASHALDRRQFAIDHVRQMMPGAMLVIGAENVTQMRENCALFEAVPLKSDLHAGWNSIWPRDDTELIDPRGWTSPQSQKKT
jgi:aryl-alcohol dehydrogenase-like predicted oxidoreductase